MSYFGGTYPSVRGHPPQRATQYCLLASTSSRRASSIFRFAPHSAMTLAGRASASTRFSSFPRTHFSQYGFATSRTPTDPALPGEAFIGARNNQARKWVSSGNRHINNDFTFAAVTNPRDRRPAVLPAGAVGPAGVAPFSPRRASPFPHGRNAALSDRALCPLSIVGGAPSQGGRNLVGLVPGFAFAARRSGQPCLTRDYHSPSKAQVDHVAHRLVSKSAEPVRPAAVIHQ